jgi:hypothetical protein
MYVHQIYIFDCVVKEYLVNTRWLKYDRDYLCVNKQQSVPVIFEPPCILVHAWKIKSQFWHSEGLMMWQQLSRLYPLMVFMTVTEQWHEWQKWENHISVVHLKICLCDRSNSSRRGQVQHKQWGDHQHGSKVHPCHEERSVLRLPWPRSMHLTSSHQGAYLQVCVSDTVV